MVQLQEIATRLSQWNIQIIAISPDRPSKVSETVKERQLSYLLLSDSQMETAKAFRIAYQVVAATLEQLGKYGIDLEGASGATHHLLPVPAVFLVGTDGTVRFEFVHPDYRIRLDAELLLQAAKIIFKPKDADAPQ